MKIAGLAMNDVWAHRVLRESGVSTARVEDTPGEITVLVDQADVLHHGAKRSFRPYLHLTGELRGVRPEEPLAHGVNEVTYPPDGGERVEAFYEFTNEQLTELVAKGYFSEEFRTPDDIIGIEWDMPAHIDAVVLAPTADEPHPVVFTGVRDIASLSIDEDSTQYDLAEFFADYSRDDVVRHQAQVTERSFRTRTGDLKSIFDADEFDEVDELDPTRAPAESQAGPGQGGIAEALADVEADIDAESEAYTAQQEAIEGTPENLYRQRVATAWTETEGTKEPVGEEGLKDLFADDIDEETEDEVPGVDETGALDPRETSDEAYDIAPIQLGRPAIKESPEIEAAKRALSRKVADFEVSGESEGKGLGE